MHSQYTLHLSDEQFHFVQTILSSDEGHIPSEELISILMQKGILEYPAKVLVTQHRNSFNH